MVRYLIFKLENIELKSQMIPYSHESIYGKMTIEKRGEDGTVYRTVFLTEDGTLMLLPGSTGTGFFDEKENYVEKVILVDEMENQVPITPSMFKSPIFLSTTITIEEFFNYTMQRSYILRSENQEELKLLLLECQILLESNQLIKFPYAYFDTTEKKDAILIPKDNEIILLVGVYAEPEFVTMTEIEYEEEDTDADDKEEQEEGEIDFDVW